MLQVATRAIGSVRVSNRLCACFFFKKMLNVYNSSFRKKQKTSIANNNAVGACIVLKKNRIQQNIWQREFRFGIWICEEKTNGAVTVADSKNGHRYVH